MTEQTEPTANWGKRFGIALVVCIIVGILLVAGYWILLLSAPGFGWSGGHGYGDTERLARTAARIPQWSPDGTIVVVNTGLRIWAVNVQDGSRRVVPRLRHDGQFSPSVSATGLVAYMNYEYSGNWFKEPTQLHVEVVPIDGGKPKRLSESLQFSTHPVISPDGSHVAWQERSSGHAIIAAVNTSDRVVVAPEEDKHVRKHVWSLTWSPDGDHLAVVWSGARSNPTELEIVDRTGTERQKVASSRRAGQDWAFISAPAWLPDGRLIFFIRDGGKDSDGNPAHPMKIVAWSSSNPILETVADLGANFQGWPRPLQLSSDGARMAFVVGRGNVHRDDLYTMRLDGTDLKLIDTGFYQGVSWSPDGTTLAVQDVGINGFTGEEVFTIDPNTGEKSLVRWD